jgi:hypothetical protein
LLKDVGRLALSNYSIQKRSQPPDQAYISPGRVARQYYKRRRCWWSALEHRMCRFLPGSMSFLPHFQPATILSSKFARGARAAEENQSRGSGHREQRERRTTAYIYTTLDDRIEGSKQASTLYILFITSHNSYIQTTSLPLNFALFYLSNVIMRFSLALVIAASAYRVSATAGVSDANNSSSRR